MSPPVPVQAAGYALKFWKCPTALAPHVGSLHGSGIGNVLGPDYQTTRLVAQTKVTKHKEQPHLGEHGCS